MSLLAKGSIKRKITMICLLTTFIAILSTILMLTVSEVIYFRNFLMEELSDQAKLIGTQSRAALVFKNGKAAEDVLKALNSSTNIVCAVLYDSDDKFFAGYSRDGLKENYKIHPIRSDSWHFSIDHLDVRQNIKLDNDTIGSLYMRSDLSKMYVRLIRILAIALIVILISAVFAVVLLSQLHKIITKPIFKITKVMHRISKEGEYASRVDVEGDDEVGILANAFNDMLAHIQERDEQLAYQREHLQELVFERTEALEKTNKELW